MIEDVAYRVALQERAQFLDRLTRLSTALRRLQMCNYDLALAAVKGLPEEDQVRALARRLAQGALDHAHLEEFLEEAGVDPESYDSAEWG